VSVRAYSEINFWNSQEGCDGGVLSLAVTVSTSGDLWRYVNVRSI